MAKFEIAVEDQDALDAVNAEIARIALAGTVMTHEEYLSDFITTQHANMREPQLLAAAQAKVLLDPDLKAYRDRKAAAAEAIVTAGAAMVKP